MTLWFGKSWGAPICEPEMHVETPLFQRCYRCQESILKDDQGVVMPYQPMEGPPTWLAAHIDCFVKVTQPHGPECPHCRGVDIGKHAPDCRRNETGICSCQPMPAGVRAARR